MPMDLKDWLTVGGWLVTFALGLLSGGYLLPKWTRKHTRVTWSVEGEAEIVPRALSRHLGTPVVLQVGGANADSLSTVVLSFAASGTDVARDLEFIVRFDRRAVVLGVRHVEPSNEYHKHVRCTPTTNDVKVAVDFLNPGQRFALEFIVGSHATGSVKVDAAAAGLELSRRVPSRWQMARDIILGRSPGGGRETAIAMLSTEVRELRQSVNRASAAAEQVTLSTGDAAHLYRMTETSQELSIVRYLHGVDDDWVSIETLASHAKMDPADVRRFVAKLCEARVAASETDGLRTRVRLTYRV